MIFDGYDTRLYETFRVWTPRFEGDESDDSGANSEEVTEIGGTAEEGTTVTDGGIFNEEQQKELNRILAAEKKKHKKLVQKAVEEANALRSKAKLTANERAELDGRLELIQNELRTKEEQAKRAAQKLKEKHKTEKQALQADRDTWRNLYTESTIERSITDAAASNNAFSPKQVVAILGPNTTLVPTLDEEGQPTSILEPKVRFSTKDKDGKPVTLDLSPADAVKRMKEEEEFLNLFRSEGSGGAGLRSRPGGKKPDTAQLAKDPAAWRAARKDGTVNFRNRS